jgi:hypothetical protein
MQDNQKPRFILGLVILGWGIQADLIWFAIPMAIVLEARYFLNRRWALTQQDFYRVADLTTVGMIGMIIFLSVNARTYHFITSLLQWLPIVFFPLTAVLAYSTTNKMSLDILFYSLRRQKEPVQQSWDMDYFLLGATLLAAGTVTDDHSLFFPLVAFTILWCLYPLRSRRYQKSIWVLAGVIIIITSSLTHLGLRQSHLALKAKTDQWIANWISHRTDPLRTRTALGKVGQLKLSDAIRFRIEASGELPMPGLLHEASYNYPGQEGSLEWAIWDPKFRTIEHTDDFIWRFGEGNGEGDQEDRAIQKSGPEGSAKLYIEFDRERALIPVPASLSEINDLPALDVKSNVYGTIIGTGLVPSPAYQIKFGMDQTLYRPPDDIDLIIAKDHEKLLSSIVKKADYPAREAISFVRNYFSDFRYSLFQDDPGPTNDPLSQFLLERKAGHCEYFATATTLLLRQMGIPARYVVGFAVEEYNESLGMYIVRQRHAHAWTIAYVDDKWLVIDTTPGIWLDEEDYNSSLLQPILDFVGNHNFLFQLWWNDQKLEDYETYLWLIGGILTLILIWRISNSEQVILTNNPDEDREWLTPGADSPFRKIETHLFARGLKRDRGELLRQWILRIQKPELLPFLTIHNRWRFDPRGVQASDRDVLNKQIDEWLTDQKEEA